MVSTAKEADSGLILNFHLESTKGDAVATLLFDHN
jgi:hypothetical protein